MLKNNGKQTAVTVAGAACLCLLLLLLVALQHHRAQPDDTGTGTDAVSRVTDSGAQADALPGGAQAKRGFSAYFTKLTRGRREVERPAASATDAPPAEDIGAGDIFVAVKTTKKFHRSRLSLLLDTWISRNAQQVNQKVSNAFLMFSSSAPL